ncbi:hypothetical protein CTAYLR_003046 [Chrysophaeum taylorii]|uniref:HECT domain-containing protein n=1 Tax=Chrysophaeum taylorii TaxID=2483200 RepID=A0AAD7XHJ2_9STRA|nr:hypothetical protein CTAYLR_003046 [Chrysophaeum taylorii]
MEREEGQELRAQAAFARSAQEEEMARVERTLSSEGRMLLAEDGLAASRLASIRSSLDGRVDPRSERARLALERGMPLERAASSPRVFGEAIVRRNSLDVLPSAEAMDLASLSRSFSLKKEESTVVVVGTTSLEDLDEPAAEVAATRGAASSVYSWGRNRLMHGPGEAALRSIERFDARRVRACATSGWHALCADDEGNLFGAGANASGEAGEGGADVVKPQRVEALPVGVRVALVACGVSFSVCVTFSGQVLAWGANDVGQLGDPSKPATRAPTIVRGVPRRVAGIGAGDAFVVARTEISEVYVWGAADACCADDASAPKRLDHLAGVPVASVVAGAAHAIAVSASGAAYAWGRNQYGQCGVEEAGDLVRVPRRVEVSGEVSMAAAGRAHSLFAVESRRVYGLGRDRAGQISGSPAGVVRPPGVRLPIPAEKDEDAAVVAVAAGDSHSLVATTEGVWAVGSNRAGALGCDDEAATVSRLPLAPQIVSLDAAGDCSVAVVAVEEEEEEESSKKFGRREDSFLVFRRPLSRDEVLDDEAGLGRTIATFRAPGLLSASFLRRDHSDLLGLDLAALEAFLAPLESSLISSKDEVAKAVRAGADSLSRAAEANTEEAARTMLVYLRTAAALDADERRSGWAAARAAVELLLATSDECRAAFLAAIVAPDREDLRETLRKPLKALVKVAAMRAAIEGALPSGDGVDLRAATALVDDLDAAASSRSSSSSSSSPREEESLRSSLLVPANLARRAMRSKEVFQGASVRDAFDAAFRGAMALDLLRSASWHRVPRSELSEGYRVPEVDALGVIVPRRVSVSSSPGAAIGIAPSAGALLIDFMRWRDSGAPRGGRDKKKEDKSSPTWWCFASFPFLLAPETKRELCAVEARRRQGAAGARAQQMLAARGAAAFAFGGFPLAGSLSGHAAALPYLVLEVPRAHLFQTTLDLLSGLPDSEFSKELKVVFQGEEGVDEGGVKKEFFALLVPQLFDPVVGMFVELDTLFFNPLCDWYDVEYELAGILVGLAAYNQVVLDVRLPRVAYKKLLAYLEDDDDRTYSATLDDLAEIDRDLAEGLRKLLEFTPAKDVEDVFCRSFVVDDGDGAILDLVPGGSEIAVTGDNRQRFVSSLLEFRLETSVDTQFQKFAKGFGRVMRTAMLPRIVEPEELALMVQGDPELDFEALERAAYYEGFDANHPLVREFWNLLHHLDPLDKKKFLMFTTGSKSAPMGGLAALRPPAHTPFKIQRAGPDSDRLPTASVCFNTLLLPDYDPPSKLGPRLKLAITETEGFGLK